MVATQSTMVALGTQAPTFALPDTEGKVVRLSDFFGAPALLVIFMCNHCPYVIHIREKLVELIREHFDLRPRGLITMLDLLRPIYSATAAYGHFGRTRGDWCRLY